MGIDKIENQQIFDRIMGANRKIDVRCYLSRLREENYHLERYIQALENENMQLLSRCNQLEKHILFLEDQLGQ